MPLTTSKEAVAGAHAPKPTGAATQAIATGRAVSELVLDGGYATLDLAPFGYGRYARGERMLERNIV